MWLKRPNTILISFAPICDIMIMIHFFTFSLNLLYLEVGLGAELVVGAIEGARVGARVGAEVGLGAREGLIVESFRLFAHLS